MQLPTRILAPLLGLAATCTVAPAAALTFVSATATAVTSFSPPAGMETVAAFNFGSTATVDLGGVGFQGTGAQYTTVNGITTAYSIPNVSWASRVGSGIFAGNGALDSISLTYNTGQPGNGANGRLEFSGLTIGRTYTFQFIAADGRGSGGNPPNLRRFEIVGADGGNVVGASDKFTYAYNDGRFGVITASFTADNTVAWFHPRVYENNGTAVGTQINAVHIMATAAPAADGVWTNPGGGAWSAAGNWRDGVVANGGGRMADFSTLAMAAEVAVSVDRPVVVGQMIFGDPGGGNRGWTLGGGGPLLLEVPADVPLVTNPVPVTITTPLTGTAGLTKAGNGTLTLGGHNTYTGTTTISAGTLRLTANQTELPAGLEIMPMGDSITYGGSGTNAGYRGYLYSLLAPVAPSFQFIGVSSVNPAGLPTSPIDQTHHNGYSSYATLHLSNNLDGIDTQPFDTYGGADRNPQGGYWLVGGNGTGRAPAYPDVVLIMAGANDIFWNTPQINTASYQANLTTLLGKLTTLRPNARVIVAKITPWPSRAAEVTTVNAGVATVVANFQAQGKPVSMVDLHTGFPANGLSADGLHPGDTGYAWMAGQWRDAIVAAVGTPTANTTALPAASSVTVAAGATLDLNDTRAAIAGLDAAGSVLLGSGTLATAASATFAAGSSLAMAIDRDNPSAGHLAVTGNLTLGNATLAPTLTGTAALNDGTKFVIATYTGTLAGTFAGLPEGSILTASGTPLILRYADGGNNITLTVGSGTTFQMWLTANYPELTGDAALPGSDPDDDGLSNLGEFAFKGDPTKGGDRGPSAVLAIDANGNTTRELTLTVAVRAGATFAGTPSPAATIDGVTYTAQGSLDLAAFAAPVTELTPALTPAQTGLPDLTGSGWEYHTFVLTGSEGLPNRGFLRAMAEGQ